MVAYLKSKHDSRKLSQHILSIHICPCPTSFRPLPFGLKFVRTAISMHYSSAVCVNVAKQKHGSFWTNSESVSCCRCPCHNVSSRFGSHFFNQSAFEMHWMFSVLDLCWAWRFLNLRHLSISKERANKFVNLLAHACPPCFFVRSNSFDKQNMRFFPYFLAIAAKEKTPNLRIMVIAEICSEKNKGNKPLRHTNNSPWCRKKNGGARTGSFFVGVQN